MSKFLNNPHLPDNLEFEITKDDHDKSIPGNANFCVVATCVKRILQVNDVAVLNRISIRGKDMAVYAPEDILEHSYITKMFDRGKNVVGTKLRYRRMA